MYSSPTSEEAHRRSVIQRLIAELASTDIEDESYEIKLHLLGEHIAQPPRNRYQRVLRPGESVAGGARAPRWRAVWHRQKARMTHAAGTLRRMMRGAVTGRQQRAEGERSLPADRVAISGANADPAAHSTESGPKPIGRFTEGRFGEESQRSYLLYEPASRRAGPAPLLVLLHGCGQSAADFAAGTRMNEAAEDAGVVVLYPEQSPVANTLRCWNWYALQDRSYREGDAALIAAMTRQMMREHDIDPARVYVAGMSAGGAMAAVLARDYPKLYAALGVHSGVPAGLAHDVFSAMRLMSSGPGERWDGGALSFGDEAQHTVARIVFHGDEDTMVHPSNGEAILAAPRIAQHRPLPVESLRATTPPSAGQRGFTRSVEYGPDGVTYRELWIVHGAGHAWAGGSENQRHTDASGPNASREMVRFFLQHHQTSQTA